MSFGNKTKIGLAMLALMLVLACTFWIRPLLGQIKEAAENFVFQKNRLAELEAKKENLRTFEANREVYRASLERVDGLFINAGEPVIFIEFLENEAVSAGLSIEITPFPPQKNNEDLWQSMNFRLVLKGEARSFLQFLERLEYSDYLLQAHNLSVDRPAIEGAEISFILLIKVYSK